MFLEKKNSFKIKTTSQYELELSFDQNYLLLRLILNSSTNTNDIYEAKLNSIDDIKMLNSFQTLEQLGSYIKDANNVEVKLEQKLIVVLELAMRSKKKIQMAAIPLNFINTVAKSKQQRLTNKIISLTNKKEVLRDTQIKDIFEEIAIFLFQSFKQKEKSQHKYEEQSAELKNNYSSLKNEMQRQKIILDQIQQQMNSPQAKGKTIEQYKYQQNQKITQLQIRSDKIEKQFASLQVKIRGESKLQSEKKNQQIAVIIESLKNQINKIENSFKKQEREIKIRSQQILHARESTDNIGKELGKNNLLNQQKFKAIQQQLKKFEEKNRQISEQNGPIFQKINQNQKQIKQFKDKSAKLFQQFTNNIHQELNKVKNNLKYVLSINNKNLFTELTKTLRCEDEFDDMITQYEDKNCLTINFREGATEIPVIIGKLESLQTLLIQSDLKMQKLKKLPESFKNLKRLNYLKFQQCLDEPTQILKRLQQLPCLQTLVLRQNPLKKVDGIQNLKNLTQLQIFQTSITQFPNVFLLPKLKNICLMNNKITQVSDQISKLSQLEQLDISENPLSLESIKKMAKNLKQVKTLRKLDLSSLNMKLIPEQIFQLEQLFYLSLKYNLFTSLPPQISKLKNLSELYMDKCGELSILSDEIGSLSSLKKLSLISTKVSKFPPSIGNLQNLQQLNACGCVKLTQLPIQIEKLKNLKVINLNDSKLKSLPKQFFNITSLTNIQIKNNEITELQEQISLLSNIKQFSISQNKLTRIPKSLDSLSKQALIGVKDNPLESSSLQILKQMKKQGFKRIYF